MAQHIYEDFNFIHCDSSAFKKQFIFIQLVEEGLSGFILVAALLDGNLSAKGKAFFLYLYRTFSTRRVIT